MKGWLGVLAPLVAAVALGVLWVGSCSGPDPVVADVRLIAPAAESTPYRVETTVRNRGQGEGQIEVDVRLRDPATGRSVQRDEKVQLERGQTVLVVTDLAAPPASYTPEVEAQYPPR